MQPRVRRARFRAWARARRAVRQAQFVQLVQVIRDTDQAAVHEVILRISSGRRWLTPLTLAVGAVAMLFDGVRLLFANWRLLVIQVLPAMWIWAAMFDLKVHVLRGKSFRVLDGPVMILAIAAVIIITAASFFLNAVFAYAVSGSGPPQIRPAFSQARTHLAVVLGSGAFVGLLLGLAAIYTVRHGRLWFAISMSIIIGIMMLCYVTVPARLIGAKTVGSRRDKLTASAVGGAVGAVICTPPYLLGRLGLIMLGSHTLFIPGVIVFAIGMILQAGATGAVKTIKMSARLAAGRQPVPPPAGDAPGGGGPDGGDRRAPGA